MPSPGNVTSANTRSRSPLTKPTSARTFSLGGWIVPGDFDVEGKAYVCAGDLGCAGGDAVLSTKGIAFCAKFGPVHAGVGYKWNPGIFWTPAIWLSLHPMLSGCDVADYAVARPPEAARAGVHAAQ